MTFEEIINELKKRGHEIGTQSAISHDGKLLRSIDGRMMKYDDVLELLEHDKKKQKES